MSVANADWLIEMLGCRGQATPRLKPHIGYESTFVCSSTYAEL